MKTTILNLFAFLFFVSLSACSDKDNPAPGLSGEFKCSAEQLDFPIAGGDNVLTVMSAVRPEITVSETWVAVGDMEITGSQKNIYRFTLTAAANPEGNDREATATVKAGSESAQVKLLQSAKPVLEADAASLAEAEKAFKAQGGDGTIKINYNLEYEVNATAEWITIADTRAVESKTISFTVAPNTATSPRTASIVIAPKGKADVTPLTVTVSQEASESQQLLGKTAMQIAAEINAGINIGNTMEATGGETSWGNPKVNESYIQGLKDAGFNAVRIPCAWDSYIIDRNANTIDPAWLARVNEVVGWIVSRDMYAIVNIHWDGGWLEENVNEESKDIVIPKQKALWTQIANNLNGYNERLLFAGTNEPYQSKRDQMTAKEMAVLLEYEQVFIDAVRATGGNNAQRTLIFQGPATDITKTNELMTTFPTDKAADRLMAEIHYYDPWNFCGMEKDESWGNMFYFWGQGHHVEGSDRNATWGEEDHMKSQFDKMKAQFVDKGIPVVIGEYGAIVANPAGLKAEDKAANVASRAYFDQCVSQFGKERGLIPFLWDTGEIFDRNTGAVKATEIVKGVMDGSAAGKYPFSH